MGFIPVRDFFPCMNLLGMKIIGLKELLFLWRGYHELICMAKGFWNS